MKTVAVTGSTGALGTVVVERLGRQYAITTISRETFADAALLREVSASADAIVHCAGKITVSADLEQNVEMAKALAVASGRTPILNFSSCAVYGHPNEKVVDESMPCRPVLDYGKSKLRAEQELDAANVCHMRIGNVFTEAIFDSVLNTPLKRFLRGGEFSNLISAKEVAEITAHLLALPARPGIVNVTRDDLGPMIYADVYASRTGRRSFYLPPLVPHLVRLARRQQSVPADRIFSNARLLSSGYLPLAVEECL